MTTLQFRPQNEAKLQYATRISPQTWQGYEATIRILHDTHFTRSQILAHLHETFQFLPSPGQLNAQMKKWGMKVYGRDSIGGQSSSAREEPVRTVDQTTTDPNQLPSAQNEHSTAVDQPTTDISETASATQIEDLTATDQTATFARLYPHFFNDMDTDGPVISLAPPQFLDMVLSFDPMLTDNASRTSSHRAFQDLIINIDGLSKRSTASSYGSRMSTMSRESWGFTLVTGMPAEQSDKMNTHEPKTCHLCRMFGKHPGGVPMQR